MSHWVTLNLGRGRCATGFPVVTAQLWQQNKPTPIQSVASLPACSDLEEAYHHWQRYYVTLHSGMAWRRSRNSRPANHHLRSQDFEIEENDITIVSRSEFQVLCETLSQTFNRWLHHEYFRRIDQMLRTHLHPQDEIRFIITADHDSVLQLPWHLWQLLEDYPLAELALSPANYGRSLQNLTQAPRKKVRILAILGDAEGIDIVADRRFLEQLPQTDLTFLVEPDRATLNEHLWQGYWDILFFAGHSSSQGQGQMQMNAREYLTIEQLKYGLRAAIANGLKLAIFNSCEGLGLARDLADLHLAQVIVMREPVPDFVAQVFLKEFLSAFSQGRSLYFSVRQAREKLQVLEETFPCATWLPVVCQNPAEVPPRWQDWCRKPAFQWPRLKRSEGVGILWQGLLATGLVATIRGLGLLQPLELVAFDRFMQLRPAELPDPRLLVVRITESDIQAEGSQMRQGSLSDRTLSRLLQTLQQAQPRVIGLDLYRDFSASPQLQPDLRSERLIAICKRPDATVDPTGILPPPEVSEERLGFSDFVQDEDGVVRRHLMYMSPNPASTCSTSYALSTQLAFRYLFAMGIQPQFTAQGDLQLGDVTFARMQARTGGYQSADVRGGQILLNYRAAPRLADVAEQVTVAQVLQGKVNAAAIRDRVVVIGVDASSSGDRWSTIAGKGPRGQIAGVLMQAQMTSQILSAVLDGRSLLWVWSAAVEWLWLGLWAVIGSGFMRVLRPSGYRMGAIAFCLLFMTGICFAFLLKGGWIPFVPAVVAMGLSIGMSLYQISQKQGS